MKIVIGLGNPGERYRRTRHNVGFRVVDRLAERAGVTLTAAGLLGDVAWTASATFAGEEAVLAKPRTYMNRAGRAARDLCQRFGATPPDLVVVHDDADLAFGLLRLRLMGGHGGHNGVRSLIDILGNPAFPRVRLGIRGEARGERELAEYVLEPFAAEEQGPVEDLIALAAEAVEVALHEGFDEAMNRFNGRSVVSPA